MLEIVAAKSMHAQNKHIINEENLQSSKIQNIQKVVNTTTLCVTNQSIYLLCLEQQYIISKDIESNCCDLRSILSQLQQKHIPAWLNSYVVLGWKYVKQVCRTEASKVVV